MLSVLALVTLISAPTTAAKQSDLRPFRADYKVRFGVVTGKSTMTLSVGEDGIYYFDSRARPNWFVST